MAAITTHHLVKEYPGGVRAVDGLDLTIDDGEFFALLGPSGCGKTTLLRTIAGLESATDGRLHIGDRDVTDLQPGQRQVAMVFQDYALFPHMSVADNIAYPLKIQKVDKGERLAKAEDVGAGLSLDGLMARRPGQLSGGQQQRVALARAVASNPQVFLFDEPLSNLDAKLRGQMRAEISRLQRRLGITTVYVTHDQTEAMTLGDRVAVLRKGELQQVGSPRELYEEPVNLFVAGFIGSPSMNFLPASVERAGDAMVLDTPLGRFELHDRRKVEAVGDREIVLVGIRPEHFEDASLISEEKREKGAVVRVVVDVTEWLGNELYAYVPYEAPADLAAQLRDLSRELDSDQMRTQAVVALDASSMITPGREAELWIDTAKAHIFDPATGRNLTRDEERAARLGRMADDARAAQRSAQREAPGGGREDGAEDGAVDGGTAGASAAET